MNATAAQGEPEIPEEEETAPGDNAPQDDLLLGLQLCRANTMSLTRLQLALRTGNRRSALEAIDRLHALDARIERLLERTPTPANETSDWQAIAKHLEDQKIAIAFEKLALASEIRGPDMVSSTDNEYDYEATERQAPWPFMLTVQPDVRRAFNIKLLIGALVALLAVVAISSAAIVMSAL